MLKKLCPRLHQRYFSLPIFGSIVEGFAKFLRKSGYKSNVIRSRLHAAEGIDHRLQQLNCRSITKVTRAKLRACAQTSNQSQKHIESATIKLLERFFDIKGFFPPPAPRTKIEKKIILYSDYLLKVRGFSPLTIKDHTLTASQFLIYLKKIGKLSHLKQLVVQDIEYFVHNTGKRMERARLQHIIAHLRSFLRFLATKGETPIGLDSQIDTPRTYREEKLPRSLDWDIVLTLLKSINRSTAIGKRDYAILLLITTYGLRASEVVNLKLENIDWRTKQLQILQHKTTTPLILPLTTAVSESIIDYLKYGRPSVSYREIFVRHKTPAGILKRTAINKIPQTWSRRNHLLIPYKGSHCLRHSYAIHLLRKGISIKTIGDILGHRSYESTCVYLRLNVEDLRTVPLSLPLSFIPSQRGRI